LRQSGFSGARMSIGRATDANWSDDGAELRPGAAAQARSARAYLAARRHSRLVRILRVGLIAVSLMTVAFLLVMTGIRTFRSRIGSLSVGQMSIDGTKITMDQPRLTGARQDGRGYVINAAKAIQDITDPTHVELRDIGGDIGGEDHDMLHISATRGWYDTGKELLDLAGSVALKNSSYIVKLSSGRVDFKANTYSTREPLTVITSSGATISSDSAWVRDSGAEIQFEGHVKTMIRGEGGSPTQDASMKGTSP